MQKFLVAAMLDSFLNLASLIVQISKKSISYCKSTLQSKEESCNFCINIIVMILLSKIGLLLHNLL